MILLFMSSETNLAMLTSTPTLQLPLMKPGVIKPQGIIRFAVKKTNTKEVTHIRANAIPNCMCDDITLPYYGLGALR